MILLIDNYDSFTYNLFHILSKYEKVKIYRNDEITLKEINKLNPNFIVISPGPKAPKDAGITLNLIKNFYKKYPILGICLGHQSIYEAFGGKVIQAKNIFHGKISKVNLLDKSNIFKNIASDYVDVVRYHSLIANKEKIPKDLIVTSETKDGVIMSVKHKKYPVYGLQFHPESYKTKIGEKLIKNFLRSGLNVS